MITLNKKIVEVYEVAWKDRMEFIYHILRDGGESHPTYLWLRARRVVGVEMTANRKAVVKVEYGREGNRV